MHIRLASTELLVLIPSRDRLHSHLASHLYPSDLEPILQMLVDLLNSIPKCGALKVKAFGGVKRFSS